MDAAGWSEADGFTLVYLLLLFLPEAGGKATAALWVIFMSVSLP